MIYDIIGDIHGQLDKLTHLLNKLGYRLIEGVYTPPCHHQAIFVGDFVDRGANQLDVLTIVFNMLDKGYALAVMGNHEYNAIAYSIYHDGDYLRPHSPKNTAQHQAFLAQAPLGSDIHAYWINRFYELPLWLELDELCVIHACWDKTSMDKLRPFLTNNRLTPQSFVQTAKGEFCFAIETLLKGIEIPLPDGIYFADKDGTHRDNVRLQWWQVNQGLSYRPINQIARVPKADLAALPDTPIGKIDFELETDKPIFIGHYWLTGLPMPLTSQVVCVDYSAGGAGDLVAYRFDTADKTLNKDGFVW